jgi:hypothetical protein
VLLAAGLMACSHEHGYIAEYTIKNEDGTESKGYVSAAGTPDVIKRKLSQNSLGGLIPGSVYLVAPVDAVFVGVSNFEPSANRIPTPAHAIGAAFMHGIFYSARSLSEEYFPDGGWQGSRLSLLTDLRLDPVDPSWQAANVAAVLGSLPGSSVRDYRPMQQLTQDRLWRYLGNGTTLTKSRILQAAREQATRLASSPDEIRSHGIFFLATHGALAPDGKSYAMAADSVEGDFSTWISYQELADIFGSAGDSFWPLARILIIDTCLTGEAPPDLDEDHPTDVTVPDGIEIITSAAPGQYSVHWREREGTKLVDLKMTSGSSGLKATDADFYYSLSVLPVALAYHLKRMEREALEACDGDEGFVSGSLASLDVMKYTAQAIGEELSLGEGSIFLKSVGTQRARILIAEQTYQQLMDIEDTYQRRYRLFGLHCELLREDARFDPRSRLRQ